MARIRRTGLKRTGRTARVSPTIPTSRAARTPSTEPSTPPSTPPIGMVPHTNQRIVAFIRPCIRAGVTAWRRLTWATL